MKEAVTNETGRQTVLRRSLLLVATYLAVMLLIAGAYH
jgi:hypothetical protein